VQRRNPFDAYLPPADNIEIPSSRANPAPPPASNPLIADQASGYLFSTAEIRMTDLSQAAPKRKGGINLRENLDDNFREFFSDNVIVDNPDSRRRLRDDEEEDEEEELYESYDDSMAVSTRRGKKVSRSKADDFEAVSRDLNQIYTMSAISAVCTGIFSLCMLFLSFSVQLGVTPDFFRDDIIYYSVSGALLIACFLINIRAIIGGLLRMFIFKATGEGLLAFAMLASVAECAIRFMAEGRPVVPLYGSVATIALFLSTFGNLQSVRRVRMGFVDVSATYDKFASSILDDSKLTRRLVRESDIGSAQILLKTRCGQVDDYMAHAFTSPRYQHKVSVLMSLSVLGSLLCAGYTYYIQNDITTAIINGCITAILCAPFSCVIAESLPIWKMHKKISRVGAVIPGYSAADEICAANCVILEGRELFPQGNVLLHGIKTFERERIDKAILYAASVIVQTCDTMSHMFMNVIQNKSEMLYELDSVEYESGFGYRFWIEGERILIGTRDLLIENGVEVPSREYENKYTKTSTRDAIYLAVSGKLYAMFVVSYTANPDVYETLQSFADEGINILVRTRDFNLTPDRIARFYGIPPYMISVIREEDQVDLSRELEYKRHTDSLMTHMGSIASFTTGIIAAYNLRDTVKSAMMLEFIAILLSLLLSLALTVIGSLGLIGILEVFAFQLIWYLILYISVSMHRY